VNYYMISEPLAKSSYARQQYTNALKTPVNHNKGILIEINESQLHLVSDYAAENNLRPVLLINSISNQWTYSLLTQLQAMNIHGILIAPRREYPFTVFSNVAFDFYHVFIKLLQYMRLANRKNVALFGISASFLDDITKFVAFTYSQPKDTVDNSRVFWNRGNLDECCEDLYANIRDFDAVICSNEVAAVKLINFLSERNVSIPDDIYLATVGKLPYNQPMFQNITTVDINFEKIGALAIKMYSMLVKNPEISYLNMAVGGKIIPNESTNHFNVQNCQNDTSFIKSYNESLTLEDIWTYSDIDVNKMHLVEQLVGHCDSLDINILYGLTQNKRLTDLENELFTTMNTIKYRIKKMCAITGTSSRDELKELATYFLS